MQWLIDIIKEWAIAQGYLKKGFELNPDFPGDYTPPAGWLYDNLWYTVDVSDFVPEGVRALDCAIKFNSAELPAVIYLRPTGFVMVVNTCVARTVVTDVWHNVNFPVALNNDRKFDYRMTADVGLAIKFRIHGWWY